MSALHLLKLKLKTSGVASNDFRVAPVFIYYSGSLMSDIIREEIQHAKPEFLYDDSDMKSANTSGNIDSLRLIRHPVSLFYYNSHKMRRSETSR